MARIRSFHQGFLTDEAIVELPAATQILLIGLWTECDDQGVFEWKPVRLKMRLFPVAHVDIVAMLAELTAANVVKMVEVEGVKYGLVRNFRKYQKPRRPTAWFPLPDEFRKYVGLKPGDKASTPASSGDDSGNDDEQDDSDSGTEASSKGDDDGNGASLSDDDSGQVPPPCPTMSGIGFQMERRGEESREEYSEANASGAKAPQVGDPKAELFGPGVLWLRGKTGKTDVKCRSLMGKWRRDLGDDAELLDLLAQARALDVLVPEEWFAAAIRDRKKYPRAGDRPPRNADEAIAQRQADPIWAGVH